jgi:hypothetical protein
LLIGGYAVNYYGYAPATADIDIWIAVHSQNAERVTSALKAFGFTAAESSLFLEPGKMIRLGVPPLRIEFVTAISGVGFEECYASKVETEIDGVPVKLIDLNHLKANKLAAGRFKDLNDLEQLKPAGEP